MVFVGCKNTIDNTTNKNHIIKMSSKQYYNDIKSMRMTTKLNKLIERNNLSNLFSSTAPSRRTSRIEQLSLCIRTITEKLHKLIRTLMESKVREWKFDKYRYQQKKIIEICKMLSGKTRPEQERNVIVGWGNWSNPNNSIIRGHKRGPVKRIVKELRRWCRVETIDEYNTSKKCSKCYNDTEKMKYPEIGTVNDVLRCKNEKCRTYFDRDINGARNMLKKLKVKLGIEMEVVELRRTIEV
jgi:transposase